ncbi:DUF5675 family protein [Sphingobacterium faecium]|uniref:DUF5675 family protein n=1 Tax=Sphingobacterium faecium TaxID=34087 RepID=UPI0024688B24|nr:DUF5675 family protein [Sphingobacterium faecium]MDH5827333.1 DUF5675 family protein [Sphingobacterium faecium]
MVVGLLRTYHSQGTNGEIWIRGEFVCYAIELPWLDNVRNNSCIPEGIYVLTKRYSKKFKWHVLVKDVYGRSDILFHPANDARIELRGCIAPVSQISGIGRGVQSVAAFNKLRDIVYASIDRGDEVLLEVLKKRE